MPTKSRSAARTSRDQREPTAGASHPPAWIKPQLAALVKQAPDGPDWLHELKLDGYRMHARLYAGRGNILTRRGNDWTDKYPTFVEAIAALPAQNAYLDGELAVSLTVVFGSNQRHIEQVDSSSICCSSGQDQCAGRWRLGLLAGTCWIAIQRPPDRPGAGLPPVGPRPRP